MIGLSKGSTPCYGCGDRIVGCHSSCEKYAEYHKKIAEIRKERWVDASCKDVAYNAKKTSKRDARNGHNEKNVRNYRG